MPDTFDVSTTSAADATAVVEAERQVLTGTAVVVGASGALGSALTRRLVERGLTVLAVGRSGEALQELATTVVGNGLVVPCAADIGKNTSVVAIDTALADLDEVVLSVLCAGLPVQGSVEGIDPDLLAVGAQVKMAGAVRMLHAVRRRLAARSRFVAVAGTLGLEPGRDEAGPGGINAGLINLMKQIANNHGADGLTVHTFVPGPMDTPRLRRIAATIAEERGMPFEEVWADYASRVPLGRLPRVEEVIWMLERLLDPEADILHGTITHLDGGGLRAPT